MFKRESARMVGLLELRDKRIAELEAKLSAAEADTKQLRYIGFLTIDESPVRAGFHRIADTGPDASGPCTLKQGNTQIVATDGEEAGGALIK